MNAYQLGFIDGHRGQQSMAGWWVDADADDYTNGVAAGKAHAAAQLENDRILYAK